MVEPYVFGRPREWDREKIAKDLLEWAQKDTSTNLCEFCALNMIPPEKISIFSRENDDFRQCVSIAKQFIGIRREQKLSKGQLHQKAYDLNAPVYDFFLKEEKREQAAYEASLSNEDNKQSEALQLAAKQNALVMEQIKVAQSLARSIEDKSNKAE